MLDDWAPGWTAMTSAVTTVVLVRPPCLPTVMDVYVSSYVAPSASAETVSETQHALELSPLAESYHGVKPNLVTPVPSDGHVYAS